MTEEFGRLLGAIEATLQSMQTALKAHFEDEAEQNRKIDCIVSKVGEMSHQLTSISASSMDTDSQRILHMLIEEKRKMLQRKHNVVDILINMLAAAGIIWIISRLFPGAEEWFR
jgi:C4-dicarboxylate-specific signal transduction histidine kinase